MYIFKSETESHTTPPTVDIIILLRINFTNRFLGLPTILLKSDVIPRIHFALLAIQEVMAQKKLIQTRTSECVKCDAVMFHTGNA